MEYLLSGGGRGGGSLKDDVISSIGVHTISRLAIAWSDRDGKRLAFNNLVIYF
jgi:hypothetical protein